MAWVHFNPNPYGKTVGDCTVRALCAIENLSWMDAYMQLCFTGGVIGDMPDANETMRRLLLSLGYSRHFVQNTCPDDCYTIRDFCKDHPTGRYLVNVGRHVVGIVNGDYYDTGDSGNDVAQYYYTKEK